MHEEIAIKAMNKGINVFCEKPMAINLEQAENMLNTAKEKNVKLMIGHCVRFFPEYTALKKMIDSKEYGNVVNAEFVRLSALPKWSWQNWMLSEDKGGGNILDVHIHDTDFINYAFGIPKAVKSFASAVLAPQDMIETVYDYGDERLITAKSACTLPQKYPFKASFFVRFEKALVEFDGKELKVYTDEDIELINLPKTNPYAEEEIEFIRCLKENAASTINSPESSLNSLRLAFCEKESAISDAGVEL